MANQSIHARQLYLILGYSIRHSVRGGAGLVFLLLALFFGLGVAQALISPVEMLLKQAEREANVGPEDALQELVKFAREPVAWAVSPRKSRDPAIQARNDQRAEDWATYLLDRRPALLSAILFILLFGLPFLVPFGAFNQTSGDIGNRGLRYLLLRTERPNIFLGRLLGTALFTAIVLAMVVAATGLYLGLKVKFYGGGDLVVWSLLGYLALLFLALPYVALCAWFSAANDSPMVCLVLCKLLIGGVLLASFLGAMRWEAMYYLKWLLPWGIQNELLAPTPGRVATAMAACLGYTLLFGFLGLRHFQKRDL